MQYKSIISSGKKIIAKVKIFVHASNAGADADADTRGMILAPRTFVKSFIIYDQIIWIVNNWEY